MMLTRYEEEKIGHIFPLVRPFRDGPSWHGTGGQDGADPDTVGVPANSSLLCYVYRLDIPTYAHECDSSGSAKNTGSPRSSCAEEVEPR